MIKPRHLARAVAVVMALGSTACLEPSLNPLVLPAASVFDARLLGAWTRGTQTWTFSRHADKEVFGDREFYEVTVADQGETVKLWAWLGRLGDAPFINFFPDEETVAIKSSFYKSHLLTAHTFGRAWIEPAHVRFGMLKSEWVEKAAKAGTLTIGQTRWPDGVIVTARTADLQRFARAHLGAADEAFGELIELTRQER